MFMSHYATEVCKCPDNSAILGDFGLVKEVGNDDENDADDFKGDFAMPNSFSTPVLVAYAKSEASI